MIQAKQAYITAALFSLTLNGQGLSAPTANQYRNAGTPGGIRVLQNRFFNKTWRPELSIGLSSLLNDAYTSTRGLGFKTAVFPTEWWGFELSYEKTRVQDSNDRKALRRKQFKDPVSNELVSADAEVNALQSFLDFGLLSTPFYGKINLLDAAIVYTDIYLSLGLSKIRSDQGTKLGITAAIGQRVYITESVLSFFELKDRVFKESRSGLPTTRHALSMVIGVGVFVL